MTFGNSLRFQPYVFRNRIGVCKDKTTSDERCINCHFALLIIITEVEILGNTFLCCGLTPIFVLGDRQTVIPGIKLIN